MKRRSLHLRARALAIHRYRPLLIHLYGDPQSPTEACIRYRSAQALSKRQSHERAVERASAGVTGRSAHHLPRLVLHVQVGHVQLVEPIQGPVVDALQSLRQRQVPVGEDASVGRVVVSSVEVNLEPTPNATCNTSTTRA